MASPPVAAAPVPLHEQPSIHARRWFLLAIMCLSLVLVVMTVSGLNTALPTIQRDLGASASDLQWIVDAYAIVFAGLLLSAGAIGDRFGRRRALLGGLAVFGLGTLIGGVASSSTQLIAGRAVMGIGAAFIMPATLSIITAIFPPDERTRAIADLGRLRGRGGVDRPRRHRWAPGGVLVGFDAARERAPGHRDHRRRRRVRSGLARRHQDAARPRRWPLVARRPELVDLRHHPGPGGRMDQWPCASRVPHRRRRTRGLRRLGAAKRPPDAAADPVPRSSFQHRHRRHHDRVLRDVRLLLPRDAVLPVRPRVLSARGGPRHTAGCSHVDRGLAPQRRAGAALWRPPRDGVRARRHRRRARRAEQVVARHPVPGDRGRARAARCRVWPSRPRRRPARS